MKTFLMRCVAGVLCFPALLTWAGDKHRVHFHEHVSHDYGFGQPGEASRVDRTIMVTLGDMYFQPESIEVDAGETVRFVLRNEGQLLHEFNLGDENMHRQHQQEMQDMLSSGALTPTGVNHTHSTHDGSPVMHHDDPNSALVEPGQTAELIWMFEDAGVIEFACNVPGHYELGMVDKLRVR